MLGGHGLITAHIHGMERYYYAILILYIAWFL